MGYLKVIFEYAVAAINKETAKDESSCLANKLFFKAMYVKFLMYIGEDINDESKEIAKILTVLFLANIVD